MGELSRRTPTCVGVDLSPLVEALARQHGAISAVTPVNSDA